MLRDLVARAEALQARNDAQRAALARGLGAMADRATSFVGGHRRAALGGDSDAIAAVRTALLGRARARHGRVT